MDNNENNFQANVQKIANETHNVNQQNMNSNVKNETFNVNESGAKKQKKVAIILVAVVLILVVAIGIGAGLLLSGAFEKDKTQNEVTNNPSKSVAKTSKKIDESKPWVYTADYCISNSNKKAIGFNAGAEFNSKDYLKVPFINMDSDYAKKANEEIKTMYDNLYKNYGEKAQGGVTKAGELKYEFGATDKIISVAIIRREGVTNAGWSKDYIIYNINLETSKQASFEEVYKECGFENVEQLEEKIKIIIENDRDSIEGEEAWNNSTGLYYMNANKEFNIVVNGHMSAINLTVKTDAEGLPEDIKNAEIVNTLVARGWAGSSMHRVRLYSNGDAYFLIYNGEGETEDCIISRELLAKNVENIEEKSKGQEFEGIVLKGKDIKIIKEDVDSWIIYEKTDDDKKVVNVVSSQKNQKQMLIEGKNENNNVVWTYTTPETNYPVERVNEGQRIIGQRNGKVYLCDWGKLYILDEQTGKVLNYNDKVGIGAATCWTIDEDENIYTISYLSALNVFDKNAKLIKQVWDLQAIYNNTFISLNVNGQKQLNLVYETDENVVGIDSTKARYTVTFDLIDLFEGNLMHAKAIAGPTATGWFKEVERFELNNDGKLYICPFTGTDLRRKYGEKKLISEGVFKIYKLSIGNSGYSRLVMVMKDGSVKYIDESDENGTVKDTNIKNAESIATIGSDGGCDYIIIDKEGHCHNNENY